METMTSGYAYSRAEHFRIDADDAQDQTRRMLDRAITALDQARFIDCREYLFAALRDIAVAEEQAARASLMQAVGDELKGAQE